MSSVVFRDDIDRTPPHMSKAIKTRAAVKEYRQAAVEESKSAAKKSKYALSSTGSKPVLGDISTSLCHRPCIYKSIVLCASRCQEAIRRNTRLAWLLEPKMAGT
jgi:hypothetical protein